MKKNNKIIDIKLCIGIIIGISIMAMLSFTKNDDKVNLRTGVIPISSSQANTYFRNYMSTSSSFNGVIKGYTVDKNQLDAMTLLSIENRNLTGFRIYNGKDENSEKMSIVVGIDNEGKDATSNSIYNTDSPTAQPCPTLCDLSSSIINDK